MIEPEFQTITAEDDLRDQMAVNGDQLIHLQLLKRTASSKSQFLLVAVTVLVQLVAFVAYILIFDASQHLVRKEVQDLSGIILVFLIFALVQSISAWTSARAQCHEAEILIHLQFEALKAAQSALAEKKGTEGGYK